jgi:nitrite reductase/ring-hydroxylating ferredoxin subunit
MAKELGRLPLAEVQRVRLVKLPCAPYHVAVAWIDGAPHAVEDACPHSGVSLSTGTLRGHAIRCPGHDWDVDVRTGQVVVPPLALRTRCYRAWVEGDQVVVGEPE